MQEAELLTEATGHIGRLVSREAAGEGAIAGFIVEDGDQTITLYVDTSQRQVATETGLALPNEAGNGVAARIWMHPADPYLPALGAASFRDSISVLLDRMGEPRPLDSAVVAYRPGKRAVVRLSGERATHYLKVVRPSCAEQVWQLHRLLREHGLPVPEVTAWSPEGLLVIDAALGDAGPEVAARVPDAAAAERLIAELTVLRSQLARVPFTNLARASLAQRSEWYFDRLADAGAEDEVRLLRRLAASWKPRHAPVGVHGDLHLGQLFFDNHDLSGLIDVDTSGLGDPADDAAAFIGHALVSAVMNDASGKRDFAAGLMRITEAAFDAWATDDQSRALTAVHLAAHAGGALELGDRARTQRVLASAAALLDRGDAR